MLIVVATTIGLMIWIVLWAIGGEGVRRVHDHGADRPRGRHRAHAPAVSTGQPALLTVRRGPRNGRASRAGLHSGLIRPDRLNIAPRLRGPHTIQRLRYRVPEEGPLASTFSGSRRLPSDRPCSWRVRLWRQRQRQRRQQQQGGGGPTTLTIYSSLPLQGESRAQSTDVVNGEKLALEEAGGKVGKYKITYKSLDDSTAAAGKWEPGQTSADARKAAQDQSTIVVSRRVQLRRVGDLASDHERGRDPAGLPVEHLRRPDPLRGRGQGRAGQVLPVRQAHLRPRRARRPHPGGGPGGLPEG